MQAEYSLAILVAGPDQDDVLSSGLPFFARKFENLVVIGDGKRDIYSSVVTLLSDTLASLNKNIPHIIDAGRTLVIVGMHGAQEKGIHYLLSSEKQVISTASLFSMLNQTINKAMDIIFTPCNGKAALVDVDQLPKDSRILMFSEENSFTASFNCVNAYKSMDGYSVFSLEAFYDNYLSHLGNPESPIMVTVGNDKYLDPLVLAQSYLSKPISLKAREYVHQHFGYNVCTGVKSNQCHHKLELIMDKMETSYTLADFSPLINADKIEMDMQVIINKQHALPTSINNTCSSGLLKVASELNQYLFALALPLSVDLSKIYFQQEDKHGLAGFKEMSLRSVYDAAEHEYCVNNGNFPEPEYSEYGSVLGIAKDIAHFLNASDFH